MHSSYPRERRRDPRRRSLLGAVLRIAPDMSASGCVVRDIHSGGRLLISDTILLSETFDLTFGRRRETKRARLVWRREGAVGVAFVPSQPAAVIPLDLMRALHAARADRDALRRRVAELQHRLDRAGA